MKILTFDANPIVREVFAEKLPGHEHVFFDEPLCDVSLQAHPDAEIISMFVASRCTREQLDMLPNLKMVALRSAGFDNIDLAHATARGIVVARVPKYGQHTVAEFTIGLMLMLTRKLYQAAHRVHEEKSFSQEGLEGFDVFGKTLGVLGTGNIGRTVVAIAQGLGMEVLMHDTYPAKDLESAHATYVSIDDLLARSDIVTVHVPYLPETHHIINAERMAKMKRGAYLINTARGELVDTDALVPALKSGQIGAAALDVLEAERNLKREGEEGVSAEIQQDIAEDHELMGMDNVIITPHVAFYSREANRDIQEISAGNIAAFIAGAPQNTVSE